MIRAVFLDVTQTFFYLTWLHDDLTPDILGWLIINLFLKPFFTLVPLELSGWIYINSADTKPSELFIVSPLCMTLIH